VRTIVLLKIERNKILILFIVPFLLYIALLPFLPLLEPDEARYSNVSRLMNLSGDYVTPHLLNVLFFDKPPLTYWATAAAFKVFGENEFSARLFAGLSTWACILLVYYMGVFSRDKKTGLHSAAAYSTFLYVFLLGRMNIMDSPLTLFLSLAIWAGYRYYLGYAYSKKWLYVFYLACALAFLTKGLMGFVFPPIIMVLWLLICGRWREVFKLVSPMGILIFLCISVPWVFLIQRANPDFLWFFFVREQFMRYTTSIHGREHSWLFYIPVVLIGTLPWTAPIITAFREKTEKIGLIIARDYRYLLFVWTIFILVFFSFSSAKMVTYIASVFLPIAVVFGNYFRLYDEFALSESDKKKISTIHVFIIVQAFIFIAVLLMPLYAEKLFKLNGDLRVMYNPHWMSLIILPICIQVLIIFMPDLVRNLKGEGWFLTMYCLIGLFMISLIPPVSAFLIPYKTSLPIRYAIKLYVPAGHPVYQYGIHLFSLDFGRKEEIRTPIVEQFAELNYGISQLPARERDRYFLKKGALIKRNWDEGPLYCITDRGSMEELAERFPTLTVLWKNGNYFLVLLPRFASYALH